VYETLDHHWYRVLSQCVALISLTWPLAAAGEQSIAGWVERVAILEADMVFDAKLDSGADNSSLNVKDLVFEERGGRPWVRFVLRDSAG